MIDGTTYFLFWFLLVAVLLYFPVTQWIWVLSVRRLQRKMERELSEEELAGQKQRARVIAAVICPVFSFFFNSATLGALS